MSAVRGFAVHLHALDPRHQVPPSDMLPRQYTRPAPYLFSNDEIAALIRAASRMRHGPGVTATYQTLIGLLAVTGMRPGEACRLDREHFSPRDCTLTIVRSKYGKSRQLLLDPTTVTALEEYGRHRDRLHPHPAEPSLLVSMQGTRMDIIPTERCFVRLTRTAGIQPLSDRTRPRMKDLRHTFAVSTLISWYRSGADVEARLPALSTWLGHVDPQATYWKPGNQPGTPRPRRPASRRIPRRPGEPVMSDLAPVLQGFFTDRMITQKHASEHTIRSYRDTWRLLLAFAQDATGTPPWKLDIGKLLDAGLITAFLRWLETSRGCSPSTRNARLSAIRSLFRYASLRAPDNAAVIQRVLAIEASRTDTTIVSWLTDDESDALAAVPDQETWTGCRDYALLLTAIRTGLRVSELTRLTRADIRLGAGAHVRCTGKGRKERCIPLDAQAVAALRAWLGQNPGSCEDPLFVTRRGTAMSRDAVYARITKYQRAAAKSCPSLAGKNLTPHTLRHSTAMHLRHSGVDSAVIALWMGHQDIRSTQVYIHADLKLKEKALDRVTPPDVPPGRFQPPDKLLAFLESL